MDLLLIMLMTAVLLVSAYVGHKLWTGITSGKSFKEMALTLLWWALFFMLVNIYIYLHPTLKVAQ